MMDVFINYSPKNLAKSAFGSPLINCKLKVF